MDKLTLSLLNVSIKEKKAAGRNWGKPNKWEQTKGSRRLRKQIKQGMKKYVLRNKSG